MKKLFVSALSMLAVALGFTACSSEDEFVKETPAQGQKVTVIASTEEPSAQRTMLGTKGTDGTYPVLWSATDKIKIGGNVFTLTSGANNPTGVFEGDPLSDVEGITAYYPSTYNGENWPTEQTYVAGNIPLGVPMKATGISMESGAMTISFKNVGGILRLKLTGTAKVKSIKISATNLSNPITLNCGEGEQLDEDNATPFHIAVKAADYSGLKIEITDDAGKVCTKTLKSDKTITVRRSMITDITVRAVLNETPASNPINDHDYVDLAGSRWATENVGAVTDEGGRPLYLTEDATYGYYYNQSNAKTAAASWGGRWSLPTTEQWNVLIRQCYWQWTDDYNGQRGMIVYEAKSSWDEGRVNYGSSADYSISEDRHIFLPAAGIYYDFESSTEELGIRVRYWSTEKDYSLFCNPEDSWQPLSMINESIGGGLAVRLVLQ